MTLFHTLLVADDSSEADVAAVASTVTDREPLVRAALDLVLEAQGEPPGGVAASERPVHRYFSDAMRVGRPPLGVLPRIAARVLSA